MGNIIRPTETWKLKQQATKAQKLKGEIDNLPQVPYERSLVEAVDKLIEVGRFCNHTVHTEKDWEVLEYIIRMWTTLYPQDANKFFTQQKWNKNNQKNDYASDREKGGAEVRHLLELPLKLYEMMHVIFPDQKFDKNFSTKFARRFSGFRWSTKV